MDRQTDKQTDRRTDKQTDGQTDKRTGRWTNGQADGRTDRQTNRLETVFSDLYTNPSLEFAFMMCCVYSPYALAEVILFINIWVVCQFIA